ncbi:Bug family tripartite tricarboxylate transporter substrate binding protein [Variovorax sp. LT1R16]|uniref:Bug family tripartite tricarboxylate transporter substrate binding protein n=1 Tax=Variovorax sp. LT1R16 TaxID=3443728 RepID=UPI003F45A531
MTLADSCLGRRAFLGAGLACSPLAMAQQRPVRVVATFGAGGIADMVARLTAPHLAAELGEQVVVENRTGASGAIGAQWVAQSPADGYTLMLATPSTLIVNPLIHARWPSHAERAFVPVSLFAESPVVLVAQPRSGPLGLSKWVQHARANPGRFSYASAGAGTTPHLGMELFKLEMGVDVAHVPFRSGAEAAAALLSGSVDLLVEAAAVVRPFVEAGQMQALCAPSARRCAVLPYVETAAEQGFPTFDVPVPWFGLVAPAAVTSPRRDLLEAASERALARPSLQVLLTERGMDLLPGGAHAFRDRLVRDRPLYERVIRAARVSVD